LYSNEDFIHQEKNFLKNLTIEFFDYTRNVNSKPGKKTRRLRTLGGALRKVLQILKKNLQYIYKDLNAPLDIDNNIQCKNWRLKMYAKYDKSVAEIHDVEYFSSQKSILEKINIYSNGINTSLEASKRKEFFDIITSVILNRKRVSSTINFNTHKVQIDNIIEYSYYSTFLITYLDALVQQLKSNITNENESLKKLIENFTYLNNIINVQMQLLMEIQANPQETPINNNDRTDSILPEIRERLEKAKADKEKLDICFAENNEKK
jgi:hypothetical protein